MLKFRFGFTQIQNISTTRPIFTRTEWSKSRKKVNQPKCYIPRYLLNGSFRKGHGRSGRNDSGRITTRHRGGFCKQNYRIIDFMRVPITLKGSSHQIYKDEIVGISFDPCRSALIAKIAGNLNQNYKLILAATGMKVGDVITKSRGPPPNKHKFIAGDSFALKYYPPSSRVYNIESYPGSGGRFLRCGDSFGTILSSRNENNQTFVTLSIDNRNLELHGDCIASCGQSMTNGLKSLPLGKAGRARRYGMQPKGKTGLLRLRNRRQRGRKNLKTYIIK